MTGQFGGDSVSRLAKIEAIHNNPGRNKLYDTELSRTQVDWLIEEVKRLQEANVILTNGIQRIGTHDVQLITATAGDYLTRAVAAMKGEVKHPDVTVAEV